jgi:beta-lysine 5,6-aminomutase alpha subunit
VAMLEYDMPPHELALDVASGTVDLRFEAELLERPDRLAAAEQRAAQMLAAALGRFDSNRTATRESRDLLGQPPEPWLGVVLQSPEVKSAMAEARVVIAAGADVVQVHVPASWEFAEARRQAGLDTPGLFEWEMPPRNQRSRRGERRRGGEPAWPVTEPTPAGSQRGLASLRNAVDDAAAERRCYTSLMTVSSAFAAPEQAVVAAFERIDYVGADPIREIVEDNVDPERALADHAFAHRLQARAGCRVVIGPGPLALGADVASGIPSDGVTRAGCALALQALNVELALADGMPADRLVLGAVPHWVASDNDPNSILLGAWLRRVVFPDHRLVVDGPTGWLSSPRGTAAVVSALAGAQASMVVEPCLPDKVATVAANLAAAARAARAMRLTLGDGAVHGDAEELADNTLRAADAVLVELSAEGWGSLLGPAGRADEGERLGRSAVVERADGPTSGARLLAGLI